MPSGWDPERDEEAWSDQNAWRGDLHPDVSERWRQERDDAPGGTDGSAVRPDGDVPALEPDEDWPENLAGPEYWLYKRFGL